MYWKEGGGRCRKMQENAGIVGSLMLVVGRRLFVEGGIGKGERANSKGE
jgi:hypothetical protein